MGTTFNNVYKTKKKTVSPPHLEIDFLLDSGASPNVLNNDTWNEIQEYHKLKLQASTFVLSAANNSRLQSNGTIKLTLHPDVSEKRDLKHLLFSLLFHVSNTKLNILDTPFLEKYVESFQCSTRTLEIKTNNEIKSLKFYDSSIKPPPYYSRFFPVIGDHSLYFTPSEHRILTYHLTAYECKNKYPNGTIL